MQLLVVGPGDDVQLLKEEVMSDMADIFSSVDKGGACCCILQTRCSTDINEATLSGLRVVMLCENVMCLQHCAATPSGLLDHSRNSSLWCATISDLQEKVFWTPQAKACACRRAPWGRWRRCSPS